MDEHGGQRETAIEAIPKEADACAVEEMIGTRQAAFDVAEDGVETLEFRDGHAAVATADDQEVLHQAGVGDAPKSRQAIARHAGVGDEVALAEAFELGLAEPRRPAGPQPYRVTGVVAGQGDDERNPIQRAELDDPRPRAWRSPPLSASSTTMTPPSGL